MRGGNTESRATSVGKWLLAAVTPASALMLGSLPPAALMAMSLLAAVACGLLWIDVDLRLSRPSRFVLLALAILIGMTVLQAIPLPASVTHALSPATADIWARALAPLREAEPAWHPLSVAPPATRVEVLRGFFYGCVFLGAVRVAALERGERFLVRLLVFSTSLMAFSALAHAVVPTDRVFGVYRPHDAWFFNVGRLSPLLNANHLAAYLCIGACCSVGALLSGRSMPRALSGSLTLVLAATCLWQGSRAASASLLFGVALTFALWFLTKRRSQSPRAAVPILAACAVAATIIVTIAISSSSVHLLSQDFSKVDVAKRSLGLVASSPWFGFGRGGFETVFSSVREGTIYVTWTNPEDMAIQWLVEWGVPVSVAGAGLLGWALRPQVLLQAVRPSIGPWVALVATVLHELADYHLEVPGIVALACICAAVVVSGRPRSREAGVRAAPSRARLAAFAVSLGAVVAGAFVAHDLGHTLAEDRRKLSAEAVDTSHSAAQFRDDIRAAMLRYPAEPFFPLMGAVRSQVSGEGMVLPWAARALERNPRFGRAHFVLARSLMVGHSAQARLEYRLAYENDSLLRPAVVKEAGPIIFDLQTAKELVPDGPGGVELLDALVVALAPRLPSTSVILDDELHRRDPNAIEPLRRRAAAAVADVVTEEPWCTPPDRCLTSTLATTDELAALEPERCEPYVLRARLLIKKGDPAQALDGLERSLVNVADRALCQRHVIAMSFESGQNARGDRVLDEIVRGGCAAASECVDLYTWAASLELGRGHAVRAVRLYRRALDLAPDREDLLERIGELGERDGLLADALEAYATLSARYPSDPRWPARVAALRARGTRRPAGTATTTALPP
jgi:tetratricopeptide (TPR) repeat protein